MGLKTLKKASCFSTVSTNPPPEKGYKQSPEVITQCCTTSTPDMVPLHFTLLSKLIIKSQSAQVMGTLQVISCCLERSSDTAYSWDVLRQRISSYPLSAQGTLPGISQSAEGRAWLSLPSQHAVTLPSAQPGASSGVLKCLCMQLSHWMGTQGFVLVELRCWSGTCRQNAHEAAKISGHRGRQHTTAVLNTTWGKTSLDP